MAITAVASARPAGTITTNLRVPVERLSHFEGGRDVREVPIVARPLDRDTYAVLVRDRLAGYVRHDGSRFVALLGTTPATATECGRTELWDSAAACLIEAAGD